ncbi:MAG: flagellar protein FlgN [Pseudomonadales bacterium]|nr:flagellar protein FlgN [Pseudomonadales bacterium]
MSHQVTPQKAQQFLELLKTDLRKTDELVQYLEAEKSAIQERDFDSYTSLLSQKKHLLVEIESLDRERQNLMTAMGFPGTKEGFEDFLQYVPSAWKGRFEDIWSALTKKLNRCKDLNQINGKILLHAQIATDRLMQMIKGVSPNETVYRANGQRSQIGNQRSLAMA